MNLLGSVDASVALRRATARDIPTIMIMMADFHSEDRLPWNQEETRRAVADLLANETYGVFWLIELRRESIGFLVLTFGFSLEFHGRDAFVDEFYIRPEFRSKGFGKKALDHATSYGGARGIRALHLEIEPKSAVRRLYEREGFEDRGYYLMSKWLRAKSTLKKSDL